MTIGMQERSFTLYNCKVMDAEQHRVQGSQAEIPESLQTSARRWQLFAAAAKPAH